MKRTLVTFILALSIAACGGPTESQQPPTLDELAEQYVLLELAMGELDESHVDAYSGPESLRERAMRSACWRRR